MGLIELEWVIRNGSRLYGVEMSYLMGYFGLKVGLNGFYWVIGNSSGSILGCNGFE